MLKWHIQIMWLCFVVMLGGCGHKGPLTLPQQASSSSVQTK